MYYIYIYIFSFSCYNIHSYLNVTSRASVKQLVQFTVKTLQFKLKKKQKKNSVCLQKYTYHLFS